MAIFCVMSRAVSAREMRRLWTIVLSDAAASEVDFDDLYP